ncbi:MAG: hypothetical protein H7Y86_21250 [Rhizobacter sp.]|nr:hypothetical protein [Ferruginibacter sp.]
MRKIFFQNLLLLTALVVSFTSCQKEVSGDTGNPVETPVDLGSKVRTSVSGFVTDENDAPVQSASVKVGIQTVSTDEYGYFKVANVEVSKNAATVNVNKTGYFPGIRTYIAVNNKAAVVRIKLLPKNTAGTVSAANGGTVTLTNGLKINLPANAVVNAGSGAAYTGTINVAAQWINPTASDLDRIMPGDLRAIDENNNMKLLVTYGMAAVELTGGAGEKLQIAPGKKAKLTLPLPAGLAAVAPATIPLWYFDETIGLWKEEGSAVKVGNTYEGEVSHFSFWNCDVPNNYIQLDMTIHDANGNPIPNAWVLITNTGTNMQGAGYTNADGYVQGAVPGDSTLKIDVYLNFCGGGSPSYTQTITSGNTNISLGTIVVNTISNSASLTGTVTNCSGLPVTNGSIMVKMNGWFSRYELDGFGAFNIPTVLCNGSINAEVIAEDNATSQQSTLHNYTINTGSNALGSIQACGISTNQFLNVSINGTPHSFTAAADSLSYFNNNQTLSSINAFTSTGTGTGNSVSVLFSNSGLGVGSAQTIVELTTTYITEPVTYTAGAVVNITEYGAVGEFISGSFSHTATGVAAPNTVYTITGNFRVRRFN